MIKESTESGSGESSLPVLWPPSHCTWQVGREREREKASKPASSPVTFLIKTLVPSDKAAPS